MSKEKVNNEELEEKRQQIITIMKALRDKREAEIFEFELDVSIIDIQYLGAINWLDERDGGVSEKQKDIFVIIEERKGEILYRYYDEDLEMIAVQMQSRDEILPSEKYSFKKDKGYLKEIENLEEKESLKKVEEEEIASEEEIEKSEVTKPQNVIQYIDVDKAYVDDWTTVRKAYGIPHGVTRLAIRDTNSNDKNPLSSNKTIDMLDNKGNVVEKVGEGKNTETINTLFEVDDATGNNPMYDDNTKLELEDKKGKNIAERNKGGTIGRFKSKKDPDRYISVEQKDIGGYVEVYAGRKTKDGNDPVEIQLETDNVEIQTDMDMQKINREARGNHSADNIDKEADLHEEHGDETDSIAIENADGREDTHEVCKYIMLSYEEAKNLALRCGYRGSELESGIERVKKEFEEKRLDFSNKEMTNEQIMDEMIDERQAEYGEIDRSVSHK